MSDAHGDPLCRRFVLDRTSILKDAEDVTCPQCKRMMNQTQFDEADHPDPEGAT